MTSTQELELSMLGLSRKFCHSWTSRCTTRGVSGIAMITPIRFTILGSWKCAQIAMRCMTPISLEEKQRPDGEEMVRVSAVKRVWSTCRRHRKRVRPVRGVSSSLPAPSRCTPFNVPRRRRSLYANAPPLNRSYKPNAAQARKSAKSLTPRV